MSRLFDGVDDQAVFGSVPAAIAVDGSHTLLIVARIMVVADNTWLSFLETETSAAANGSSLVRQQLVATLGSVGNSYGGSLAVGGTAITDSDSWMVIASTKAAGSSTPRLHSSIISGPTHRHNDSSGGSIAAAPSITGGTIRIGGNDDFANIRVAAAALYTSALTDGQIEGVAVAKTTQSMFDLTPVWLVDDNAADGFATDYMGNANRTALTGTADDADDPAGWVYGIGGGAAVGLPADPKPHLIYMRRNV